MTLREKRTKIDAYCDSYEECKDCIFHDDPTAWCHHTSIERVTEEECDEALAAIALAGEEDVVNHPSHYTQGGMECIDEMQLIFGRLATMYFCLLNAWKYRKRAPFKGKPEEDMKKSDWYLAKYKELKEGANFGVEEDI